MRDTQLAALEQQLFANGGVQAGVQRHIELDWTAVARELKRPGVTLQILWQRRATGRVLVQPLPSAVQRIRTAVSMGRCDVAGDKAFVDYSGKKVPIVDQRTHRELDVVCRQAFGP